MYNYLYFIYNKSFYYVIKFAGLIIKLIASVVNGKYGISNTKSDNSTVT